MTCDYTTSPFYKLMIDILLFSSSMCDQNNKCCQAHQGSRCEPQNSNVMLQSILRRAAQVSAKNAKVAAARPLVGTLRASLHKVRGLTSLQRRAQLVAKSTMTAQTMPSRRPATQQVTLNRSVLSPTLFLDLLASCMHPLPASSSSVPSHT